MTLTYIYVYHTSLQCNVQVIDPLHLKNHSRPECKTNYSPDKLKQHLPSGMLKSFSRQKMCVQVKIICSCSVLFRLSRNFLGYSETFQAIRKLSGPSGKYPNYLETFQTIRKVSRLSGIFPDHLENIWTIRKTFQAIWKLSGLSGKYPDYLKTFQTIQNFWTIWKISGISGNFPGYLETFWTILKISRLSRNFPDHPEIFPDGLEISQCNFTMVFGPLRDT